MDDGSLKIVAVGDLALNGHYHRLLEANGPEYPLRQVAPRWRDADLRLANLESPVTDVARVAPDKLTLRGSPRATAALQLAEIDCVSVANNHMMDFGPQGMLENCRQLAVAHIAHVGAGASEIEAYKPVCLERRGATIGLLAFCDVVQISPLYAGPSAPGVAAGNPEICVEHIRRLRPQVDWLIVQMHWGVELSQMPTPKQRDWARRMVNAGADLVLGHHPHVLQPMETIDGVPVVYSLGNFLFSGMFWRGCDNQGEHFTCKYNCHPLSAKTGWVEATLQKGRPTRCEFHPALVKRDFTVVPAPSPGRRRQWSELCARLRPEVYQRELEAEERQATARRQWQDDCRSLPRRIEVALFCRGLHPNAAEAT